MAFPVYNPPPRGPNPYQIAGQAAMQLGGQVQEFAQNQDKMRMAFEDMVEKRRQRILDEQRAAEALRLQTEEAQRKADADRRALESEEKSRKVRSTVAERVGSGEPFTRQDEAQLYLAEGLEPPKNWVTQEPERVSPPSIGSFGDFITQKYGPRPTPQQIAEGRREYGEAGRDFNNPQAEEEDIEYFANAVANATMAPSEVSRLLSSRRGDKLKIMREIYSRADQINPGISKYSPAELDIAYRQAVNPQNQRTVAIIDNVLLDFPFIIETSRLAKRSGIPAVNRHLLNARYALGDRTVTDFKTLQAALAEEIGGALGGGSVTSDFKIKYGERMLNGDLGPEEFESAMRYVTKLLENRKRAIAKTMGPYGRKHLPEDAPSSTPFPAQPGEAIVEVATPEEARALPPGTRFRTPDGRVKVR